MVIESRVIVGGAAALAIVGIALWASATMMSPSQENRGTVQVQQIDEPAWTVEVKEVGPDEGVQTAAR